MSEAIPAALTNKRPAVFLDRDGVLNTYLPNDYVKTVDELVLQTGAARAVGQLCELGLPVFVISNQQGVAKGLMTEGDLDAIDTALRDALHKDGGTIAQAYYCVHPASANSEHRKPRPGMILQAAREHNLDLSRSFFVGDTDTDAQAARAGGVGHFILVLSGKYAGDASIADDKSKFPIPPDFVAADLVEAVWWIKKCVAEKPASVVE